MNFISRAILNVKRRLSKTILLILTFFLIGNFVVVGLGINAAASNAKILTRKKMNAIVKYGIDFMKFYEAAEQIQDEDERRKFFESSNNKISLSDIKELISDERVKVVNASLTDLLYIGSNLKYVTLNSETEKEEENDFSFEQHNIAVKSNIFPNSIEFEKTHRIVDGRFYNQDEIDNYKPVVVISKALAELNNLAIGSKMKLRNFNPDYFTSLKRRDPAIEEVKNEIPKEELEFELEVIGIYEHDLILDKNDNNSRFKPAYENPDNTIFTPAGSAIKANELIENKFYEKQIKDASDRNDVDTVEALKKYLASPIADRIYINDLTILLNDPLQVDNFVKDANHQNKSEFIKITADNEDFLKFSKPLDTISIFANLIIYLVVVNAIVIISLVTALTLKNREYEIGVLLAIGTSKIKIVLQFFLELTLIATLGFSLAAVSGVAISGTVGQKVLDYTVTQTDFNEQNNDFFSYKGIFEDDFSTKITLDDVVSEYNVSINPVIVLVLYIIGLSIVMIAVLIPSIMIMRFNPKKILMTQN